MGVETMAKLLLALAAFVALASATPRFGPCPDVTTRIYSLDFERYRGSGIWFEYGQYNAFFEHGSCVFSNYTLEEKNSRIECLDRGYSGGKFFNDPNDPKAIKEFMTCAPKEGERNGIVHPNCSMVVTQGALNYQILATDYENYGLAYTCLNAEVGHLPMVWVVTRDNEPSQKVLDEVQKQMESYEHLEVKFSDLDQNAKNRTDTCCPLYKAQGVLPAAVYNEQCGDHVEPVAEVAASDGTCPGSSSWIHAKTQLTVAFTSNCDDVKTEINRRVAGSQSGAWRDPHNGGTYTVTSSDASTMSFDHQTGNKKYTDKIKFSFSDTEAGCSIQACSESQVTSVLDMSTNYCNIHDLYCTEDACHTAAQLSPTETNVDASSGQHDKSSCVIGPA